MRTFLLLIRWYTILFIFFHDSQFIFEKQSFLLFNRGMLYLFIKINHYTQLETLYGLLLTDISYKLKQIGEHSAISLFSVPGGNFLFSLGEREGIDVDRAIAFSLKVNDILQEKKEKLFGFNLMLSLRQEEDPAEAAKQLERLLLIVDGRERLWLDKSAASILEKKADLKQCGEFFYIQRLSMEKADLKDNRKINLVREIVLDKMLERLSPLLDGEIEQGILLVNDRSRNERGFLIDGLVKYLIPPAFSKKILRFSCRNGLSRFSPFQPFIDSVETVFFEQAAAFFTPTELKVWQEVSGVLRYLIYDQGRLCADKLEEDLYLAMNLYVLAYLKMMEQNLLPGLIIFEDLPLWPAAAVRICIRLLRDLACQPVLLPLVFTAKGKNPEEFLTGIDFLKHLNFTVRPMSLHEIKQISSLLYPGLIIPRAEAEQISKITQGKLIPFIYYLNFLQKKSKIQESENKHIWAPDVALTLPANPYIAIWSLVEELPLRLLRVLFTIYFTAGLVHRDTIIEFLQNNGMSREDSEESLQQLSGRGLIGGYDFVYPLFQPLKKRLKALIDQQEPQLCAGLMEYLLQIAGKNTLKEIAVRYLILIRNNHPQKALELLPGLLKEELLQFNPGEVMALIDGEDHFLRQELELKDQEELSRVLAPIRLQGAIIAAKPEEAEEAAKILQERTATLEKDELKGKLFLELARFFLINGRELSALDSAKKALIEFQEQGPEAGESLAYLEIGRIMLASGKVEESLEYFGFFEKTAETVPLFNELKSFTAHSTALFITGNYSLALNTAQEGQLRAGAAECHEWELLLGFIEVRVLFEIGKYGEAVQRLEKCLFIAGLYSFAEAGDLLYRWLGRCYGLLGQIERAVELLGKLEQSAERFFFTAEALFLGGERLKALGIMERIILTEKEPDFYPLEHIQWLSGFDVVEGRCFSFLQGRSLFNRLVISFRAFLRGPEGIEELYQITRGEKISSLDPYLSLYHFFYSLTLPEESRRGIDDRLTVLNKALMLVQQRAARIENPQDRWQYLHRNYWNNELLKAAELKKLI
jgi:hypothetical protein